MKLLFGLCLSLAFVLGTVAQSASLTAEIAELPPCALSCLVVAIEASPCTVTNQTCICTDATLQANVTGCVTLSCTLEEALLTKNVTSTACGVPIRDKRVLYTILNDTFAVLSGVIVGIRLVSKFWLGSSIGMDDYFIAITLLVGMPSSAINVHGLAANGLGKDIWTLTPAKITSFVYYFYIMEILYFTQVALLKISILFFYQRIFPAPAIKKLIWGTIAFDAVFGVIFLFISIFQCRPISYYWKKWDGLHEGSCFNANGIGWANAAISILLDSWMIVLPMSQLVHLQLHWKKKIGVAMMFVVGTFVTVISILRLQSLVAFQTSTNPTWDNWAVANWSTLEINIGIICACMPSLRVLLVHLFPNQMGTTKKSSSKYYGTGSRLNTAGNSSTIGRSKKVRETDEDGILRSQSYTVEYGNNQWGDRDETRLVQMTDLDSKSGARTGEREI